jgi:hypothetical protein
MLVSHQHGGWFMAIRACERFIENDIDSNPQTITAQQFFCFTVLGAVGGRQDGR